jgi:hypothetical protein
MQGMECKEQEDVQEWKIIHPEPEDNIKDDFALVIHRAKQKEKHKFLRTGYNISYDLSFLFLSLLTVLA